MREGGAVASAELERRLRTGALRLLLEAVPPPLVSPALERVAAAVLRRRKAILQRLAPWTGTRYVIAPLDLSRALLLELRPLPQAPRLRLATRQDIVGAAAVLRGRLGDLLDLLEGRIDGDALFFARGLSIEGNMEAVLALRNALDGEAVTLIEDIAEALGPFSGVARRLAGEIGRAGRLIGQGTDALQTVLLAPVLDRCDQLAAEIAALRGAILSGARRQPAAAPIARRGTPTEA